MTPDHVTLPPPPPPKPLAMGRQILAGFAISVVLLGPLLTGTWTSTLYAISGGARCAAVMGCTAFAMIWWRSTRGYAIGIGIFYVIFFVSILSSFEYLI
jgi:hypothetical protein